LKHYTKWSKAEAKPRPGGRPKKKGNKSDSKAKESPEKDSPKQESPVDQESEPIDLTGPITLSKPGEPGPKLPGYKAAKKNEFTERKISQLQAVKASSDSIASELARSTDLELLKMLGKEHAVLCLIYEHLFNAIFSVGRPSCVSRSFHRPQAEAFGGLPQEKGGDGQRRE
jgi:hypothetical protein